MVRRLTRITNLMVMYPIAYVVLSLPLAVGRMSTESGRNPSVTYFCVAGSMITSSGFCDVLMYTFTRRALSVEHHHHHHHHAPARAGAAGVSTELNPFHHRDYRGNHTTTVVAMTAFDPSRSSNSLTQKKKNTRNQKKRKMKKSTGFFRHIYSASPSSSSNNNMCSGNESCESIVQDRGAAPITYRESDLSRVYQETTIEVTSEPAYHRHSHFDTVAK